MKTFRDLYPEVYAFENLYLAFLKARKYKTESPAALKFEYDLEKNLFCLQDRLKDLTYKPGVSKKIRVHEPAKRIICCPPFRDRVVQQALLQVIGKVFERSFIHDSYAFRPGKGTHFAIRRFDSFKRKAACRRFPNAGFILKADVRNYYPSVDHAILISLIERKIKDSKVLCLIKKSLEDHSSSGKGISIGGPLSQLFANIYLNELDCHVKNTLKERSYLRYCDDFFILKGRKKPLERVKVKIEAFLKERLCLELNRDKTGILSTHKGVDLLGYKSFYFFKLLRKRNVRSFKKKLTCWHEQFKKDPGSLKGINRGIKGWYEYARYAESYNLRKKLFERYVLTRRVKRPID